MGYNRPRHPSSNKTSKYRSTLEAGIALGLEARGIAVSYEEKVLEYEVPSRSRKYTPDFELPNGIFIEAKGYLTSEDRVKMVQVKASNPELDIRFVFGRASNRLNKKSSTTYAAWAEKNGFRWAEKVIPDAWLEEKKQN